MPPPAPAPFAVWRGHTAAVRAFLAVSTQWRVGGAGVVIGLDYAAARAGLEAEGTTVTPEVWRDLRAIEAGAVEGFGAKR
ncbi:MAG: DUF1799 domain-containing protein [Gemmobacter sp.]